VVIEPATTCWHALLVLAMLGGSRSLLLLPLLLLWRSPSRRSHQLLVVGQMVQLQASSC